jgi:hypothetical protein
MQSEPVSFHRPQITQDKYNVFCSVWGCFTGSTGSRGRLDSWENNWPTYAFGPRINSAPPLGVPIFRKNYL